MIPEPPPPEALDRWMDRWDLAPDGAPIVTATARLAPCLFEGQPAMLKVASEAEERAGWTLMDWWGGDGAAGVLAHAGDDALLLERAMGGGSLAALARGGRDDEAILILCDAIARLHRPRAATHPDQLIPLADWFADLWPAARVEPRLARPAEAARRLLAAQTEIVPLHGDIHHGNVLDFGARGWLAIDPKRLIGDRAFDYANIFCNPDLDTPIPPVAVQPDRFAARLELVTARSGLERQRLLDWIIAWTGLSAAWFMNDGETADIDLAVMDLALAAREA